MGPPFWVLRRRGPQALTSMLKLGVLEPREVGLGVQAAGSETGGSWGFELLGLREEKAGSPDI